MPSSRGVTHTPRSFVAATCRCCAAIGSAVIAALRLFLDCALVCSPAGPTRDSQPRRPCRIQVAAPSAMGWASGHRCRRGQCRGGCCQRPGELDRQADRKRPTPTRSTTGRRSHHRDCCAEPISTAARGARGVGGLHRSTSAAQRTPRPPRAARHPPTTLSLIRAPLRSWNALRSRHRDRGWVDRCKTCREP